MTGHRHGGARAQRAVIGHLAVVFQIEDSGEAGRRKPKSTNNSKHTTQWASAEEGLDAIILKRSGFWGTTNTSPNRQGDGGGG